MNEKVLEFYEAVSADDALQTELASVTEGVDLEGVPEEEARAAMAEAIADLAAAHDLDLTAADVIETYEALPDGELSEEELAGVSGGDGAGDIGTLKFLLDCVRRYREKTQQQQ